MEGENNFYKEYHYYPQYNNGNYVGYININFPYKYISMPKKTYNYSFLSEEENINSKPYYILQSNIIPTNNQNYISRANTEEPFPQSNSQNNYKKYNPQYEIGKKVKSIYRKNDERLNINNYTSYDNRIEEREFNLNELNKISYNLYNRGIKRNKPNNYSLRKKLSFSPLDSRNYLNYSSSYYNFG